MGQKTMRSALLEKLLGRKKAAEVSDVTKEAEEMLDKAGVQRKSRRTKDLTDQRIRILEDQITEWEHMTDVLEGRADQLDPDIPSHFPKHVAIMGEIDDLIEKIEEAEEKIRIIQMESVAGKERTTMKGRSKPVAELMKKLGISLKEDAPAEDGTGGTPLVDVLAAVGATEVADAVKRIFDVLTKAGQLEAVVKAIGSEEELSNLLATAIAGGAKKDAEVAAQANATPAAQEVVTTQPAAKSRRSKGVEESMDSAIRELRRKIDLAKQKIRENEMSIREISNREFPNETAISELETSIAGYNELIYDLEDQIAEINFGQGMRERSDTRSAKELIGDYVTESTKNLASIAKAQLVLATSVDELKPLATQIKELTDRLADVEEFIADTPRQASKAAETLITNEKLQKEIQDQVGETEMVAGIRVRKVSGLNGNGGQS